MSAPPLVIVTPGIVLSVNSKQGGAPPELFNYSNLASGDNTGTGSGWEEAMARTSFFNGRGQILGSSVIKIEAVDVTNASNSTNVSPKDTVGLPVVVPISSTPAIFYNAVHDTGLGNFIVTPIVVINIPTNTPPVNYTATVSVYIADSP